MRLTTTVLLLVAPLAIGSACSGGPAAAGSPGDPAAGDLQGPYRYLAYDSNSALLLTGQLRIVPLDDSTLGGTWEIHWAAGADTTRPVGPQVGTGLLQGSRIGARWHLTLTPGWADNNVDLMAEARAGALMGAWVHSIITGPHAGGSFQALPE